MKKLLTLVLSLLAVITAISMSACGKQESAALKSGGATSASDQRWSSAIGRHKYAAEVWSSFRATQRRRYEEFQAAEQRRLEAFRAEEARRAEAFRRASERRRAEFRAAELRAEAELLEELSRFIHSPLDE